MAPFDVLMTAPTLAAPARALLEAAGGALHFMPAFPSAGLVAAHAAAVRPHAIISRQGRVEAAAMDAAPRLRVIARHGVGVDDVDLDAARARGIAVTRAPGSNTQAVAEHAMAALLAIRKGLRPYGARLAADGWRDADRGTLDVAGLRLGLLGFGAIAQATARLALAFGMVVATHDPHDAGAMPEVARHPDLSSLLRTSDALSIHCPLTPETRGLVDAATLALLPMGGIVVNTARGGIVDEAALLAALDAGRLAGAGLDVFATEPPELADRLRDHPLVLATPHVAGVTPGTLVTMGVMAAECVVAVLTGTSMPAGRLVVAGTR